MKIVDKFLSKDHLVFMIPLILSCLLFGNFWFEWIDLIIPIKYFISNIELLFIYLIFGCWITMKLIDYKNNIEIRGSIIFDGQNDSREMRLAIKLAREDIATCRNNLKLLKFPQQTDAEYKQQQTECRAALKDDKNRLERLEKKEKEIKNKTNLSDKEKVVLGNRYLFLKLFGSVYAIPLAVLPFLQFSGLL